MKRNWTQKEGAEWHHGKSASLRQKVKLFDKALRIKSHLGLL
jgi:hypothetical protein